MTKKDYELIAKVLRFYWLKVSGSDNEYAKLTVRAMIQDFAYDLGIENPRFDQIKFYEAVGIDF